MVTITKPKLFLMRGSSTYLSWTGVNNYVQKIVDSQTGGQVKNFGRTINYFTKKAQGIPVPTQDYDSLFTLVEKCSGSQYFYPTSSPSQWAALSGVTDNTVVGAMLIPDVSPSFINTPNDYVAYVTGVTDANLLAKVKNEKINLAQTFAEIQQTADLVADTAKRIGKTLILLKKGNLIGAAKALTKNGKVPRRIYSRNRSKSVQRSVASDFLSLQYGWKPLLSDIYGAAELCAEHNNRIRQKKVHVLCTYHDEAIHLGNRSTGFDGKIPIRDVFVGHIRGRQSVSFQITNDAARDIASTGISNPSLLAWELVPFSFVADWFLPVGSFLSNFDATAGCTVLNRTISARGIQSCASSCMGKNISGGAHGSWSYSGELEMFVSREVVVRRSASNSWPSNRFPALKNPLSLTHMANAIALLTVLTK